MPGGASDPTRFLKTLLTKKYRCVLLPGDLQPQASWTHCKSVSLGCCRCVPVRIQLVAVAPIKAGGLIGCIWLPIQGTGRHFTACVSPLNHHCHHRLRRRTALQPSDRRSRLSDQAGKPTSSAAFCNQSLTVECGARNVIVLDGTADCRADQASERAVLTCDIMKTITVLAPHTSEEVHFEHDGESWLWECAGLLRWQGLPNVHGSAWRVWLQDGRPPRLAGAVLLLTPSSSATRAIFRCHDEVKITIATLPHTRRLTYLAASRDQPPECSS